MSEKKKQELYNAIDKPIMYLRIEIEKLKRNNIKSCPVGIDAALFNATQEIWKTQKKILNIS
ncbi:MAG: hypothetical protein KAS32_10060 [Candidatus Peribacteraceae bacterium]|nr:hypothetical protein [Candidatus Peribacteraceae bacterium]